MMSAEVTAEETAATFNCTGTPLRYVERAVEFKRELENKPIPNE
jgi:hypothetical protein